jgi:hypothetical protein
MPNPTNMGGGGDTVHLNFWLHLLQLYVVASNLQLQQNTTTSHVHSEELKIASNPIWMLQQRISEDYMSRELVQKRTHKL